MYLKMEQSDFYEGWLISFWPKVEGDELQSSRNMLLQFSLISKYAESLKTLLFSVLVKSESKRSVPLHDVRKS